MEIRAGDAADLPALLALEQASFPSDRLDRARLRHFLKGGPSVRLLAAGRPAAGYALLLLRRGSRIARLYSLAVAPPHRGLGLARKLLTRIEQAALAAGCREIRLEVRPDNAGAIAFYERQGYFRFGSYPDFYEDGADAHRMRKYLSLTVPAAG
jgi:ribosomal protein S18 acetylase RimI-like enzyme